MSLYKLRSLFYNSPPRLLSALSSTVECSIPRADDQIYLTFDDGPTEATVDLVKFLDTLSIQPTFFWTGFQIAAHGEIARQVAKSVRIGNHLYDHRDPWLMRRSTLRESFDKAAQEIAAVDGSAPTLVRPPYGHVTPDLIDLAKNLGTRIILWDVMPGDFLGDVSTELMVNETCKRLRAGSIVVLHDHGSRHFENVLVPYITTLQTRIVSSGFSFAPL